MKSENEKIISFVLPEDITVIEIIDNILKNNNLEESDDEFIDKDERGIKPRLIILRDAAIDIFQKEISDKKIVELLAKQLDTSKQVAENIIKDINEKLIPYAKIIDLTKEAETESKQKEEEKDNYDKEKYRQDLLRKISPTSVPIKEIEEILPPKVKKPETADVEKNAEKIQHTKERISEKEEPQKQEKKDTYREPVDEI